MFTFFVLYWFKEWFLCQWTFIRNNLIDDIRIIIVILNENISRINIDQRSYLLCIFEIHPAKSA